MDFDTVVQKYLKYDEYIIQQEEKLKEVKEKRQQYNMLIINYMKKKNVSSKTVGQYDFKLNKTNTKSGFTQKFLKSSIDFYFRDKIPIKLSTEQIQKLSQHFFNFLLNSRTNDSKYLLKYN